MTDKRVPTENILTCSTLYSIALPCISPTLYYNVLRVQSTVLTILRSADNVCRGHAARGTLAGKAVCEWWSRRAVAPISGVFFHLLFLRFTNTANYRLLQEYNNDNKALHWIVLQR